MVRPGRAIPAGFRRDIDSIGNIVVVTSEGAGIPLKQLSTITEQTGAFIVYRENNERYIPIKFSVRGQDLEGAVGEQKRIAETVRTLKAIASSWREFDQLQDEKSRLARIVPVTLSSADSVLVYFVLNSLRDALLVLAAVPFSLVGACWRCS
ncbi:MAG: efflux RND transporter permease subunit [Nitrospiraceae bacterium]